MCDRIDFKTIISHTIKSNVEIEIRYTSEKLSSCDKSSYIKICFIN